MQQPEALMHVKKNFWETTPSVLKKGALQAWYNFSFLIRTESEMLNLKSNEIHWVFPTVSEIGLILSPRVFAKPSLSHHTGRFLQLWC